MRLSVLTPGSKDVIPGSTVAWQLEVVNTGRVIEGIRCEVPSLPADSVTVRPLELPLFPGETGRLTLSVAISSTFPAGRHLLSVVATASVSGEQETVDLPVEVQPRISATLTVVPKTVRAFRHADYSLRYENTGNQAIPLLLSGADAGRTMDYAFDETTLLVQPGEVAERRLSVRAPARVIGTENGRAFEVTADGGGLELVETGTLSQRPYLPRGVLTAVALLGIVALWATAFLVGSHAAFGNDPLTKTAPASLYLSNSQRQGLAADDIGTPDAVPKQGPLPPGVGGTVTGSVRATSNGQPVGRVVVSAWQHGLHGLELVSSAASQSDGSYTLSGLFPGSYLLQFHATGFRETWFPHGASSNAAIPVSAIAGTVTKDIDTAVTGLPGSLSGTIDTGATSSATTVTVTASSLLAADHATPVTVTAQPGSQGTYSYRITGLATPDEFAMRVTAGGYAASRTSDTVGGGVDRSESTIVLSAANGQISGVVRNGNALVGGATVSTTVNGVVVSVSTPTTGAGVGTFTLANLPTPATYVLTVVAEGYSGVPLPLQLAAGASRGGLTIPVAVDTNTVSGAVTDTTGAGIGDVAITVGGTNSALSTISLTAPSPGHPVGFFSLSGLPGAGSYTLTFSLAGFQALTVPLTLQGDRDPSPLHVSLHPSVGSLGGQVFDPQGQPEVNAAVTVTDGLSVHTTQTTLRDTSSGEQGSWTLAGLPPGTYTVSAAATGLTDASTVVTVTAGVRSTANLMLGTG